MKFKKGMVLFFLSALMLTGCTTKIAEVSQELKPRNSPVRIMVISDPHYYSATLTDYGSEFTKIIGEGDGKDVGAIDAIMNSLITAAIQQQPDLLVVSGDLTLNGEKASHEDLAKLLEKIEASGIAVAVIPGNHDINNENAYVIKDTGIKKTASVSPAEFEEIYGSYGYQEAISRDSHSLSYLYAVSEDCWLLMIDSSQYESTTSDLGEVKAGTLKWVEDCLEEAKKREVTVIGVTHQNLLTHNPIFSETYTIQNGEALAALFRAYGVKLNLSGHMHIQNIAETDDHQLYDCATGSLAVWPNLYAQVELSEGRQFNYHTVSLDYGKNAQQIFFEISQKKFAQVLIELALSADTKTAMAQYAAELNLAYFSGELDDEKIAAYKQDPNLSLWQKQLPGSFETLYLQSILAEEPQKFDQP